MPLDLTKRSEKQVPITTVEHDQNLTDIETLVNSLETLVGGEDVPAIDTRLTAAEAEIDTLQTDVDAAEADIVDHESRMQTVESHAAAISGNPHAVTKADVVLGNVTNDAQLKRAAGDINTFTEKAAPVAADILLAEDSAASYAKKKVQIGSIKAQDLSDVPAIAAGDAGKYLRVNAGETGFEIDSVIANDADTVDGYHATSLMGGFRNKIINGQFAISQRNGASAYTGTGWGGPDRWYKWQGSSTLSIVHTSLGTTLDFSGMGNPSHALQCDIVSGDSASGYAYLQQPIEDVRTLAGKTVTISFWGKVASGTKAISTNLVQLFGTGGSSAVTYPVAAKTLTTTWQKFSASYTLPSIQGQTIGSSSALVFRFWLDCGSDYTNGLGIGVQSATVYLTNVQVEEGSVATDFEQRHIQQELALAQRYFETSGPSYGSASIWSGDITSGQTYYKRTNFMVQKRLTPQMILTHDSSVGFPASAGTMGNANTHGFQESRTANTTGTGYFSTSWTADAEL
jgi:hypothetical protein